MHGGTLPEGLRSALISGLAPASVRTELLIPLAGLALQHLLERVCNSFLDEELEHVLKRQVHVHGAPPQLQPCPVCGFRTLMGKENARGSMGGDVKTALSHAPRFRTR